jgi:ribonuclease HI
VISNSSSRLISVYTDGAAKNNPGDAAWGVVVVEQGAVLTEGCGYIGRATNQVAELSAAIEGLSRTAPGATIELVSDSQYVLKGVSEWRRGWERRNWVNAKGEPVANQVQWKKLFALADERSVRVRWVRGHNGDQFNERCDQLANEAIALARKSENQAPARAPVFATRSGQMVSGDLFDAGPAYNEVVVARRGNGMSVAADSAGDD